MVMVLYTHQSVPPSHQLISCTFTHLTVHLPLSRVYKVTDNHHDTWTPTIITHDNHKSGEVLVTVDDNMSSEGMRRGVERLGVGYLLPSSTASVCGLSSSYLSLLTVSCYSYLSLLLLIHILLLTSLVVMMSYLLPLKVLELSILLRCGELPYLTILMRHALTTNHVQGVKV